MELTLADINDVYRFFKSELPTYFLATEEGGQPRVRPFGTVDLFEGRLYIQTGKKKDVYRQLLANPKAEICGVKGGDWWRVSGELVPDDRVEVCFVNLSFHKTASVRFTRQREDSSRTSVALAPILSSPTTPRA